MATNDFNHLTFLGCGSMNEAILAGILAGGHPAGSVTATVRRPERAQELHARYGINVLASNTSSGANAEAVANADVVIVGVKPAGVADLLREIAETLPSPAVVVSVAAAVSLDLMEPLLARGQQVVRAMPNTPSRLGRGVVSVSGGSSTSPETLQRVQDLLASTGTVVQVPENQIDAVSAVSGSGPAYAFYLAEAMAAAGAELGLDPELSELLARETVAGAGYMLAEPDADAAALRRAVTSPNGTTQAAIETFEARGLPAVISAGAHAAADRAAQITAQLRQESQASGTGGEALQ